MNTIDNVLAGISEHFFIKGRYLGHEIISSGHINSTYKVGFETEGKIKHYIFQEINTYVFKNPDTVMHNIVLVNEHMKGKNTDVIDFHIADNGLYYYTDSNHLTWRVYDYCEGKTFDSGDDPRILSGGARAFGHFQKVLSDFDPDLLLDTIPDFHNTAKRIETLFSDIESDPAGRVNGLEKEISYVESVKDRISEMSLMVSRGELPLRATHNDAKLNNVLFDEQTLEPKIVVDLDTIMPGLAMFDYGDLIRFAACSAAEDEKDTSKVYVDINKFRLLSEGFISETAQALSDKETELMVLGALTMTAECGVRFLDDYIVGDKYFRIAYPEHNLVRARCQFAMAKDIEKHYDELCNIVYKIAADAKR